MTETKFTPGPWHIHDTYFDEVYESHGNLICSTYGDFWNTPILAAAPDMYEALNGLLARHNEGSEEHLWAEWDTAAEALAKAEGRKP